MQVPEKGEHFYMLNSRFDVIQTVNSGSEKSKKRIAVGNWFWTKEDAEGFRNHVLSGTTQYIPPVHIPVQYDDKPQVVPVRKRVAKIKVTDMSKEAIDVHFASLLLNNSISHSTEVIKYASMVISAGPVSTKRQIRNIVDNFKKIHKQYAERETELIEHYERFAE